MADLVKLAQKLNLLRQEHDDIGRTLARTALTTNWQTVHRLKERYAYLDRQITRLEARMK